MDIWLLKIHFVLMDSAVCELLVKTRYFDYRFGSFIGTTTIWNSVVRDADWHEGIDQRALRNLKISFALINRAYLSDR